MQIPLSDLIHLIHAAPHAVLSTHSTQLPGFPFGTALPLIVDERHQPILLISALAEHTKNLLADPRASLTIIDPEHQSTAGSSVQDAARATMLGSFEQFTPSTSLVARYLRYLPAAEQYLQLDFSFFRMKIERTRYIGGVGRMGWLDQSSWDDPFCIDPETEQELIASIGKMLPQEVRVLGMDAYGVDQEINGIRKRHRFAAETDAEQLANEPQRWPSDWSC
jgi:hypothetical protein